MLALYAFSPFSVVSAQSDRQNSAQAESLNALFTDSGQSLGNAISRGIALGDLDGDGDLDAFVANQGAANKVWTNDGTGRYSDSGQLLGTAVTMQSTRITLSANPFQWPESRAIQTIDSSDVALGDVDGDNDLDAFVTNYNQPNQLWLNDGSGIFVDSGQALGDSASWQVALGDMDGDRDLDAFITNQNQPNRVWLNDGAGLFTDSGQILGNANSYGISLGDVDGDDDLDAFVTNYLDQPNHVWLNDGAGVFTDSGQALGGSSTLGIALADIDEDSDLDAFVTNYAGQPNKIWQNDGTGNFTDSGQQLGNEQSVAVALADVDNDGDVDGFVTNYEQPNQLWLNDGSGLFVDSGQQLGNELSWDVALGALNSDNRLDAFVVQYGLQPNRVWLNQSSLDDETTPTPTLQMASNQPAFANESVFMPVSYRRNGAEAISAIFSIDFDQNCLRFDPTDSDGDGLPDSMTIDLPTDFGKVITFDANDDDGEVDIAFFAPLTPATTLSDGPLMIIEFHTICAPEPGVTLIAPVHFSTDPAASFGNADGQSLSGNVSNGSVEIFSAQSAFLPGDCNGDNLVDAGDISCIVLDIFDGEVEEASEEQATSGSDANQDNVLNAGDIACTALIIFQGQGSCQ